MLLYFISAFGKYSSVAGAATSILEAGNLERNSVQWQQELLWPSPVTCPSLSSRVLFCSAFSEDGEEKVESSTVVLREKAIHFPC